MKRITIMINTPDNQVVGLQMGLELFEHGNHVEIFLLDHEVKTGQEFMQLAESRSDGTLWKSCRLTDGV